MVEQLSFPLIALFWFKIGRCRGRNWLNGGGGGGGGYWLKLGVATCFLQCSVEREPQEITRQM